MSWQHLTIEIHPFKYEIALQPDRLTITALHTKNYREWYLNIDPMTFELLTPCIIFDVFHDHSLNQMDNNTKIIFPLDHDKLVITIVNILLAHKSTVEKNTIMVLTDKKYQLSPEQKKWCEMYIVNPVSNLNKI